MSIQDRTDVQELFDLMNRATSMGELDTITFIIQMETSDENEYTKDAEVMQRLRACFAVNRKRVKECTSE